MAKRKVEPEAPESRTEIDPQDAELEFQKRKLDVEVGLVNEGVVPPDRKQPSRMYGPTEPPSGKPGPRADQDQIAELLARALDVKLLNVPLGLVFKDQDGKHLWYLDQVKGGEFVLRTYWSDV